MELAKVVFELTEKLPSKEKFWLISQMNRCAVSIPLNIAEGNERVWRRDFHRFLRISKWSSSELETQLELSVLLWYLEKGHIAQPLALIDEIRKLLRWIIKKTQD